MLYVENYDKRDCPSNLSLINVKKKEKKTKRKKCALDIITLE